VFFCWRHASPPTAEALKRIAELYAIEGEIRGRPPEERLQARTTRAPPLLESLHQWLQSTFALVSKKSQIAAAIRYPWGAGVPCYCEDGAIEIDNNAAESACGRWLSEERTTCSRDQILAANALPLCTA
jgi:hypothetical protein